MKNKDEFKKLSKGNKILNIVIIALVLVVVIFFLVNFFK